MNMISKLRRQVTETGEATISVRQFNQLQAEWIKRSMDKDIAKAMATEFFRWWYNQPGSNTDQGFDEWWDQFAETQNADKAQSAVVMRPRTPDGWRDAGWLGIDVNQDSMDSAADACEPGHGA